MGVTEDLADALARDVLAAQDEMGQERFYLEVAKMLASMSPSMEEGFMTAMRVRLAERRARDLLVRKLDAHRKAAKGD
ncbi:hypothetical protein GCM10010991_03820 [Gemmobacter aquaticus]|jgi:hypothetical protein|uniref:Uncharacterized protein n=1 Tax=Gemmobacter aquaticus TaxID=490185 RepID=A0A917YJ86_9RHOB|nr:hypothetical protein [Gemmobacter aquaticus]GGO24871.1 hypothetical protein GCM10010991_03820 [Gemmobacter aquaticus]